MKKLKDILKESNVQIGKVYSNPYAKSFVKEEEEERPQAEELTTEQKHAFLEAVKQYKKYGEAVYRNAGLGEVYESIKNMVEMAGKVTLSETDDWFDNVTVSRHMKRMGESFKVFEKTLKEVSTLQQRLEASYDEIGEVLGKYYEISEELDPVGKEDGDIDNDGDEDASDEYLANRRKVISKAIKNESMKLTDMIKKPSVNEAQKVNSTSKKFLKGMKKIKVKGLGGYMPGVDYVYVDGNKYYFVDFEGDHMEMKNTNTIKQLHKLHGSSLGESVNEASEEFVVYVEKDNGRKKLLHTKQSQRAANMFLTKNADKILNQSGIRTIGSMSKFHWEKDEAQYAENIKKTDMKTVTKKEWDSKHKDYKGMIKGQPYMMYMDKNGTTVYGPVNIKESVVNEAASRTAMEIGALTGMNKDAIQKFVDDNNLDIEKLYKRVKIMNLAGRMNFVTAVAGKPGNSLQKLTIKLNKKNESMNEDTKKRFDVDFYKGNGDRQTSHEEIIRGDKFSDIVSQATKVAKSKGMNYVEFYYKDSFIGSIDKRNGYKLKKGRDSEKSPLSINEAKYDIGMARKGNGITVYNRAEEEKGDYKNIAHISDNGVVKYYDKKLPNDVKKKIEAEAQKMKESVNEATSARDIRNLDTYKELKKFVTKNKSKLSKYKYFKDLMGELEALNYLESDYEDGDVDEFEVETAALEIQDMIISALGISESVNEGTKMIKLKNLLNESFGMGELPSSKLMKMKVPAKQMLKEGTRSQVGYIDNNGNIKSTYVHYDGYPENMKPGIKKHMKSEKDVMTLIKRGGARGIFDDKDIEYYDDKSAKPMSGNLEDIEKYIKDSDSKGGAEFVYLYNTKDKKWYFADTYKDKELKKLY